MPHYYFYFKIGITFELMKVSSIILSFLLSFIILSNSFRVTLNYAYYELDPIGFIEKFCENKEKPELKCNGKCHLKKIAENNTNNQEKSENYISLKEIQLFLVKKPDLFLCGSLIYQTCNYSYKNLYSFTSTYQLDRPPKF